MIECNIKVNTDETLGCLECIHCEMEDIWNECMCKLKNHCASTPSLGLDIEYAYICKDFEREKTK